MAEGVLPVCVGNATKLCDMLAGHDKEYESVMLLGKTYDTLDVTGELLKESKVMSTKDEIVNAVRSFKGGYEQIPPMYSAKKIDGKKLYELARSGVTVERRSTFVRIYDIEILSVDIPRVAIRVSCGSGTYIRALIDDIGKKLGCGAAMEKLTRTAVGEYRIDSARKLSQIEKAISEEKITDVITTLETFFSGLESVHTDEGASKLLRNGNTIRGKEVRCLNTALEGAEDGRRVRMYDESGIFTGVYEYKKTGDIYKPFKMFLNG